MEDNIEKIGKKYKLIITGSIQPTILSKLENLCQKLDIKDNVIFTGFIPKEEQLSIVAKAKNINIEKPKFTKSWDEVMKEETTIIKNI